MTIREVTQTVKRLADAQPLTMGEVDALLVEAAEKIKIKA
jgi:hypothetical protein